MLLKEYRIYMPMTVAEYRIAQLYMIAKKSREESEGTESGVEIHTNEPYEDGPGPTKKGQYTVKTYHVGKRLPAWVKQLMPKSALSVGEEAWNAYPYTRTKFTTPFLKNFSMDIETMYFDDDGSQHNVFNLSAEELSLREIEYMDLVTDAVPAGKYVEAEDPSIFVSKKTGRGPLGPDWRNTHPHVMCAYKLCRIEAKYWGFQTKLERFIDVHGLKNTMIVAHRQAWAWQDEYHGLTIEDIRAYELETQRALAHVMHGGDDNASNNSMETTTASADSKRRLERLKSLEKSSDDSFSTTNADHVGQSRHVTQAATITEEDDDDDDEFFDAEDGEDSYQDTEKLGSLAGSSASLPSPHRDCRIADLVFIVHGACLAANPESGENEKDTAIEHQTFIDLLKKLKSTVFTSTQPDSIHFESVKCRPLGKHASRMLSLVLPTTRVENQAPASLALAAFNSQEYRWAVEEVVRYCNAAFARFMQANPAFVGRVSFIGDTIGAMCIFDILSTRDRRVSFDFEVSLFFSLGSPIPLMMLQSLNETNLLPHPGCAQFYNCFLSADPLACRVEPLLDPRFRKLAPAQLSPFRDASQQNMANNFLLEDLFTRHELLFANNDSKAPTIADGSLFPDDPAQFLTTLHRLPSFVPASILGRVHGVMVLNLLGGNCWGHDAMGSGVFIVRQQRQSWSAPLFVTVQNFAPDRKDQIMACNQLILLVMSPVFSHMVETSSVIFFGAESSVGPVISSVGDSTLIEDQHQLLCYGIAGDGAGVAVDLSGASLIENQLANARHYGPAFQAKDILGVAPQNSPPNYVNLVSQLNSVFSAVDTASSTTTYSGTDVNDVLEHFRSKWWSSESDLKRLDYSVPCPEGLENFPPLSLMHLIHASYWESKDLVAFVLREILAKQELETAPMDTQIEDSTFGPMLIINEPCKPWLRSRTRFKIKGFYPNHRAADAIAKEGESVVVSARFCYGSLDYVDLSGEEVMIYVCREPPHAEWTRVAIVKTDAHGRVEYDFAKSEDMQLGIGVYPVRFVVRGDHSTATCNVFVLRENTQTALFSIDGSFAASTSISGGSPKLQPGAVEVAKFWARNGYLLIYVSGRPSIQSRGVVNWLASHGFPIGVVNFRETLSKDPYKLKLQWLTQLREHTGITYSVAYGSTRDILHYQELGVPPSRIFIMGRSAQKLRQSMKTNDVQFLVDGYERHLPTIEKQITPAGTPHPFRKEVPSFHSVHHGGGVVNPLEMGMSSMSLTGSPVDRRRNPFVPFRRFSAEAKLVNLEGTSSKLV